MIIRTDDRELTLTPTQVQVLLVLDLVRERLCASDMSSRHVDIGAQGVRSAVNTLEAEGLVDAQPRRNPTGRATRYFGPTEAGRAAVRQLVAAGAKLAPPPRVGTPRP